MFPVWILALPPPPALDEDAPANYFNLDPSTSPTVMNMTLPPPPGINPPPPGGIPHMQLVSHTYRIQSSVTSVDLGVNKNWIYISLTNHIPHASSSICLVHIYYALEI